MRNIIDAICEIIIHPRHNLQEYSAGSNRVNNAGKALEEYIQDVFAGSVATDNEEERNQLRSTTFSYLGNQNNPPDSMLRNGDAIEVKKIESDDSSLALNSSYPKAKLYANSPMISECCRLCEPWSEKEMIYAVGVVKKSILSSLALVYGENYCADKLVYERIKNTLKTGVESIPNVEFAETKELGRVNRVDPLGITYLRVRGMWGIENPFKVFDYLYKRDNAYKFNLMVIMNKTKYASFNNTTRLTELQQTHPNLSITEVNIKSPNNPALLVPAILITYHA
ncbi:MAG: NgoPII family restriction endonuclease [Alistipes sp.]